jgi:adenylate cyclase
MAPKQLTIYLSEYFEEMTTAIHGCYGTLDKYIGDGIMAFWGAPKKDKKQATHACRCAVICLEKLQRLNEQWRREGKPEVKIRIGLNTGKVVVGNVGSHDRLSYTAIGDAVNLASRLQNINKVYGAEIIVSESTYQKAKEHFQFRLLDFVAVRGKKECGYIYQLLITEMAPEELEAYNKQFREAFDAYASGKWDLAVQLFAQIKPLYPDDKLPSVYLERCANPQKKPTGNWTGGWFFND